MEVSQSILQPTPLTQSLTRPIPQTLNMRAGFLCNKEVLTILSQQRDSRAKEIKSLGNAKAARVAKLNRRPYAKEQEDDEVVRLQPSDLHTVTFECIKYLEESVHPLRRQTDNSISTLLDELEKFDLTKAERLQIVNLAPTTLVALVVCVEDFESRFPDESDQQQILSLVRQHLAEPAAATTERRIPKKEEMAMDVDDFENEEDEGENASDDDFVHEGLTGGREPPDKELDETGET
ncbi:DNA-directed RNA polymerase III subunit RPC9, partial [Phenoliferia sp. Uapishka_3]